MMYDKLEEIFQGLNYHPLTNPHVEYQDVEEIVDLVIAIVKSEVLENINRIHSDFDVEIYDNFYTDAKAEVIADDLVEQIVVELGVL